MFLFNSWTIIGMACELMLWYNQKVFKTQVLYGWTTFCMWLWYYVLFLKFKLSLSKQKKFHMNICTCRNDFTHVWIYMLKWLRYNTYIYIYIYINNHKILGLIRCVKQS